MSHQQPLKIQNELFHTSCIYMYTTIHQNEMIKCADSSSGEFIVAFQLFFQDLKSVDLSNYWNPKIIINNTAPSTSLKRWKTAKSAKNGDAYIIEKLRLKGVFSENMELHEFPFDIQVNTSSNWVFHSSFFFIY